MPVVSFSIIISSALLASGIFGIGMAVEVSSSSIPKSPICPSRFFLRVEAMLSIML